MFLIIYSMSNEEKVPYSPAIIFASMFIFCSLIFSKSFNMNTILSAISTANETTKFLLNTNNQMEIYLSMKNIFDVVSTSLLNFSALLLVIYLVFAFVINYALGEKN